MNCEVLEQIYEGKAKKIFKTTDPALLYVQFKDDATAFNGEKKGQIRDKGAMNNEITALIFEKLGRQGVAHHLVEKVDATHQLVKKVQIVPLEVIVRNVTAGSMAKRLGLEEGIPLAKPVLEFCFKNDELGDPLINNDHVVALQIATPEEVEIISKKALLINEELKELFKSAGLRLIDFKLEFGRLPSGEIILADEITPDTCRLWDLKTNEKMDKDRFRRDLGKVEEAYQEVLKRLRESLA